MSLQIAILKVLVSHPAGRATIAALNYLSILNTSGSDWTDRLKRLAARAPGLDIFGQRLILRDSSGWQITPQGRAFLDWLESGAASANVPLAEPSPNARSPKQRTTTAWLGHLFRFPTVGTPPAERAFDVLRLAVRHGRSRSVRQDRSDEAGNQVAQSHR